MKQTFSFRLDLLTTKLLEHPPPPPSPLLHVPGVHNLRDLGGLPTRSGRIKRGKIFRSAQPGGITPAGADVLRNLGVKTIFDLRSTGESDSIDTSTRVKEVPGIRRVAAPVFAFAQGQRGDGGRFKNSKSRRESYAMGDIGFRKEYRDMITFGGLAFRPVLEHIRDNTSPGCLFHCTLGRDRTGILAAVILALVGVDDAMIERDYCLSEQGLVDWRPTLREFLLRQDPGLLGRVEELENILGVSGSSLRDTLEFTRCRYGSVEGYVRSCCGLDNGDIEAIRERLVEERGM